MPDASARRGSPPVLAALLIAIGGSLAAGCADTIRPVLGGLKIGNAKAPLQVPVLDTDPLPFEYPRDAWSEGIGGETLLKIHITAYGGVDSVRIEKSSGHRGLDSAAVAGALQLRYRPARHGDEPLAVWAYLPVRYPMPERTGDSDPREVDKQ